ncbi:MAG: O-antigen ligase family protein [Sedimentisphaerales bacterium]
MEKTPSDSSLLKSKGQVILEYILFAFCLCVIALRATLAESPDPQSIKLQTGFSSVICTLVISAFLLVLFVVWLLWSLYSSKFVYRFGLLEIGLFLFIMAALISSAFASNKRAAITDSVTLIAPMIMSLLLIQVLDSQEKINLLFITIIAVGIINAYQCAEQFFDINQADIKLYEQSPRSFLESLGIEPGSFDQWHFEQRLYSKDVNGFFATGNSAGSFMMLAIFASLALLVAVIKGKKLSENALTWIIVAALAVGIITFGQALTHSKGAICATIVAGVLFVIYLFFKNWLRRFKTAVVISCTILTLAGGWAITSYGLSKGTLPGGKSMLVRWQYWTGAAKMIAEHPFAGVGPGNFANFYTHYKPAAALETVVDPHNFPLSILAQYGPLGLISFLTIIVLLLLRVIFSASPRASSGQNRLISGFGKFVVISIILITLSMLFVRPSIIKLPSAATIAEKQAAAIMLFIVPAGIFALAASLLAAAVFSAKTKPVAFNIDLTAAALLCGIIGFLLHNCIDFAIFEPGVLTAFWAIMAALIALDFHQKGRTPLALKPSASVRIAVPIAALVLLWAIFNYALLPAAKAGAKTTLAMQQTSYAHQLLDRAAEDDPLDPSVPNLNGRLYLKNFSETPNAQLDLLEKAEDCFLAAIARDRADFKNYEKLSEVCILLAKNGPAQEKNNWLNYALVSLRFAVECYPGSSQLRIESAEVAEQLYETDLAVAQYRKAVKIEDAYRNQFQIMYPGQKVFSRLGEEKYQFAKQRIKSLSGRPAP